MLRNKNLMPYVIFIAAPSVEQLYTTRRNSSPERSLKKKRGSEGEVMVSWSPYSLNTLTDDDTLSYH